MISKLFLIILCVFPIGIEKTENIIVILVSSILFLLIEVISPKIESICYIIFGIFAIFYPDFLFFTPLLIYSLYFSYGILASLIFFTLFFVPEQNIYLFIILALGLYLAYIQKNEKQKFLVKKEYADNLREQLLAEEEKLIRYHYELNSQVEIAILSERNRIAREIHDSVGHTLSSCILQSEVLKLQTKEKEQIKKLEILQQTLQKGMEDIRVSLHNLHDSSLNLEREMKNIIEKYPLQIQFYFFSNEDMDYDIKLGILSATKEIFTNIAKHSEADKVQVQFMEYKAYYSLFIKDNGNVNANIEQREREKIGEKYGIGLRSIEEFAKKYNGFLNYGNDSEGFFVYIILNKGKK